MSDSDYDSDYDLEPSIKQYQEQQWELEYQQLSDEEKKVLTVDGKDVSQDEGKSDARKERMKQVKSLTFLLNITQIGTFSCWYAVNLTVAHLPEGVLHIRDDAFGFCSKLTDVKFPKSLISIGGWSFDGCSNLGKVDLLNTSLQELGRQAFYGCENLTSMFIPDSLQKFGGDVFWNCSKLVPYNIKNTDNDTVVTYLRSQQLLSNEERLVNQSKIDLELTTLTVDGKDVDEDEADSGARKERMKYITRLTFLLNITQVGEYACYNTINLTVVHLPEGLLRIFDYAFAYCSNLTDVIFPKSLMIIGFRSFGDCSNLEKVDLRHTNLQELEQCTFYNCENLTSMFIPDSLQKFGDSIFYNCDKLVPSNIDVKHDEAVITYLRSQPIVETFLNGDIEAIKKIVTDDPEVSLKQESAGKLTPFQLSFDRPLLVKFIIQTSRDATIDAKTPAAYAKEKNAPQLVVEMLELLTADEMKACDTDSDIQAAVDVKKATLEKNKSAMAGIVDYTAREKATVLQTKMFGELGAADVDAAQVTFDELKGFCDQVKFQLAKATWYEEEFQVAMNEIAAVLNASKSCEDICEHYSIDNSDGKWSKELRAEVFNLDLGTDEVVKAKFGPPKGFPRAHEKMAQGKTLRDLNRVTFEFEDPLLMALCFEVLNKKFNIHGLKNKYLQETFNEPPNLHMNLEIKDGWLCEVQMLFRDILLIKKELHKFYDVNRADGPFVVSGKLFKSLSNPDKKQRDDDSKYRSMDDSTPTNNSNPLLETLKLKEAEIESVKRENKLKDEELKKRTKKSNV